jgi:hypothetical protein
MKTRDDDIIVPRDTPNTGRVSGGNTNTKPTVPRPTSAPPTQRSTPSSNPNSGSKEKA